MAKQTDETVASAAALLAEEKQEPKKEKKGFLKSVGGINGLLDTVQNTTNNINEFYTNWIKPIYDNRMQLSRRLNALSLIYSIVFFILYIPFLLFGKIADGLSAGREIALYACVGTYVAALLVMLLVYITSGRSQTTSKATQYKKTMKIFLYVVRIASVAISITALVITATAESEASSVFTTMGTVFAIISIIFSALPLLFGGMKGFIKWLISPMKIKHTVSFVALEWFEFMRDNGPKKKKNIDSVAAVIDNVILPNIGKKTAKSITHDHLLDLVEKTDDDKQELTLFVLGQIFGYAEQCGYISYNPCDEMDIPDEIPSEKKPQEKKGKFFRRFFRKGSKGDDDE